MPKFDSVPLEDDEEYSNLLGLEPEDLEEVIRPFSKSAIREENNNGQINEFVYDESHIEEVFESHKEKFLGQIFPQFFYKSLLSNNIITSESIKLWKAKFILNTDFLDPKHREDCYKKANSELYYIVLKHIRLDPKLFNKFVHSLKFDDWYNELADSFLREIEILRMTEEQNNNGNSPHIDPRSPTGLRDSKNSTSLASLSSLGQRQRLTGRDVCGHDRFFDIPDEFPIYVEREGKVQEMVFGLNQLDKKCGWLVLHGLGGSGKTTLASNTIRKLKETQFSDGIFWIKIDNINGQQLKAKMDLLGEFVSTFYSQEEGMKFRNEQLETVRFHVQKHFEHYKRSLLILDDVWSEEVLKLFNFGISVLVTTQDEGIINPTNFFNIQKISIKTNTAKNKDVWTAEEAIKLFNKCFQTSSLDYINTKFPIANNDHIYQILKNFNYIPYCIPLIFQYIEPLYQELQRTLKQTQQECHQGIQEELNEHCSMLSSSICKYDRFFEKWIELSERSIANFPSNLRDRFLDFAIFCESVPSEVFYTFWCSEDCSKLEVMNILSQLQKKSLIIQTVAFSQDKTRKIYYTVHNLTQQFLLHTTKDGGKNKGEDGNKSIQERHASLVERYLKNYCHLPNETSDYSLLPSDGYIYHNLAFHLHEAKMFDCFDLIFLDLGFVIEKIRATGPSDLLNDYELYEKYFRNTKKLQDFKRFVASNSSNFHQENRIDPLQLALFQPEESFVYQEAKSMGKRRWNAKNDSKNCKSIYFAWKNQKNCGLDQMKKLISFKCQNSIDGASISPNCRIVATIQERNIQIWNAQSGELFGTNSVHGSDIRFCKFSADNQFFLTGDCNGTARLWKNHYITGQETSGSPVTKEDELDMRSLHCERRRRSSGGTSFQACEQSPSGHKSQGLTLYKTFEVSKLKVDAHRGYQEMSSIEDFRCGDISRDNKWILIGDGAGCLSLWDVNKGVKKGMILVGYCEDDKTDDANGNKDHKLDENGDGDVNFGNHLYQIECCFFSNDGNYALAMHSTTVFVYQILYHQPEVFELIRVLKHEKKCYNAMFFEEADEIFVISSSHNTHLFEWDLCLTTPMVDRLLKPFRSYSISASDCHDNCHLFSFVTISSDGLHIAAFEPTRNEIYIWNRSNTMTSSISASTSMHCDSNSSAISNYTDSGSLKGDELKTIPCHSYFRSCSDVFTLQFCAEKENALFSASNHGEIVLWEVLKQNRRTSIVDLRKFAYSGKDENLRLLSIDNAGYLRLYNTLSADEDRHFLTSLKQHLKALKKENPEQFPKLLANMKITSCDIECSNIIFGSDCGDVCYFNTDIDRFTRERLHPPWSDPIVDCIFLKTDSERATFVAISAQDLCLFSVSISRQEVTKHRVSLEEMNKSIINSDLTLKDEVFDAIHRHPRMNWILVTTNCGAQSGRIFVVDFSSNQLNVVKVYGVREERISCISFGVWKPNREVLIVGTCNKMILFKQFLPNPNCVEYEDLLSFKDYVIIPTCIPRSLAYDNRKSILYVGHDNGTIASFKWTRGRNENWGFFNECQKGWILETVLCPDYDILISGSDGSIGVWRASTGELLQSILTQGKVYKMHVVCERIPGSVSAFPKITIATVSDASCLYTFQSI